MPTVRIRIAGHWTALEFAQLLSDVQFLAEVAAFSDVKLDGQTSMELFTRRQQRRSGYYEFFGDVRDELRDQLYMRRADVQDFVRRYAIKNIELLQLRRVQFASPGLADLAGIGKIVQEVRIFLTDIIDRFLHAKDRAIARDLAAQEVLASKLKNAERLAKLMDKVAINPEMRQMMLAEILGVDQFIEGKILDGKITGFEEVKE